MVGFLRDTKNLTGLLSAFSIVGIIACISTGQIKVPLPPPALGKYVNPVPKGVLPWKPRLLEGKFAPNTRLHDAVRLFDGQIRGAESVAVRPNGDLALLDKFGNLFEARSSSSSSSGSSSSTSSSSDGDWQLQQEPIASLGAGRPLGYHFDGDGNLVICDSLKGLLKYDYSNGQVTVLANRVSSSSPLDPGSEVTYANDLAIALDGKVYFTSCSDIVPSKNSQGFYDTFRAWSLDLAQGLPKGRLMVYDPLTQETVVLAKGLYYVNGVALSKDESYLLLAETDRIRVVKYWLKGPKAGIVEPLMENLPGVPDGISTAPDGHFWVGLVNPVPPIAALLKEPIVRALYAWLPAWARPPVKIWGAVAKITGDDGAVLSFLMDPSGQQVYSVSAAVEHDGRLFLGNLAGNFISYIQLSAAAANPPPSGEAPAAAAAACKANLASPDEGCSAQDKAALFVDHKLLHNKVVVFSKSYCPFCRKAKAALGQLLVHADDMAVVELDEMAEEDAAAIQEVMEDRTGARTVPRVFVGGRFLGGGDDTAAKAASGELRRLLQEQGLQLKSAKSAHNIG